MISKLLKSKFCALVLLCCLSVVPSILASDSLSNVTLAWDANKEECLEGYKIYYGYNKGGPYDVMGSPVDIPLGSLIDAGNPEITIADLDLGIKHYFVATAYSIDQESGYSNEVFTGGKEDDNQDSSGGCFILTMREDVK